jgi:Protein of unknown function (DUF3616)
MMDDQAEAWATRQRCPLKHLEIAIGIVESGTPDNIIGKGARMHELSSQTVSVLSHCAAAKAQPHRVARGKRALILAFVPVFILVTGGAPPAIARDHDAWHVKGTLFGKDGKKSTDISGIACSRTKGFPRSCLVIDDNLQSAQFVVVHHGKLVAGDLVRLISNKYKGKRLELDGEGIAYSDGYYYVMGSHGYPRDTGHKLDPIKDADEIRARITASSQIVRVTAHADAPAILATGKLRAIIAANPVLSPYLDRRLEFNGITIEGVAVKGGRLFAGFRAPSLDSGHAAVLSVQLGALFGKDPAEAKLYRLPLGDGQGVRDLTPYANGFLVLAGPAADGGGSYAIYWWDGASENIRRLRDLADVTGGKRKAEALLPLDESPSSLRALILFDGAKQGAPVAVEMPRP